MPLELFLDYGTNASIVVRNGHIHVGVASRDLGGQDADTIQWCEAVAMAVRQPVHIGGRALCHAHPPSAGISGIPRHLGHPEMPADGGAPALGPRICSSLVYADRWKCI
jgi:hypothetical protein